MAPTLEVNRILSEPSLLLPLVLIAIGAVALLLRWQLTISVDPNEPGLIPDGFIPGFSHLLGLIWHGQSYPVIVHRKHPKPISTMQLLNGRMYLVNTPGFAQALQKSPKALSFEPIIIQSMRDLLMLDADAMRVMTSSQNGSGIGMWKDVLDVVHSHLAQGDSLDVMNLRILNSLATEVNNLAPTGSLQLWEWVRHNMTIVSSIAIYGSRSPLVLHPGAESEVWEFADYAMLLSTVPLPRYFVRKGWNARQRLFDIFQEYVDNKAYDDKDTSGLIKGRARVCLDEHGLSPEAFARGEVFMIIASVMNSIPTTFWLISYIMQDPKLLEEVRSEIDRCISTPKSNSRQRNINVTKLRTACPLFYSVFREALRITGPLSITRQVTEDTRLTNQSTGETVFLKKDAVIQVPGNVIHEDIATWGRDAMSFNPRRFMGKSEAWGPDAPLSKAPDPAGNHSGQPNRAAYRSFGGGVHLCPGRHLALMEVMGVASLFIVGLDINGVDGKPYRSPELDLSKSTHVITPLSSSENDGKVDVRSRAGYESVEWHFEM